MEKVWLVIKTKEGEGYNSFLVCTPAIACKNETSAKKAEIALKEKYPHDTFKIESCAVYNGPLSRAIRDFESLHNIKNPIDNGM